MHVLLICSYFSNNNLVTGQGFLLQDGILVSTIFNKLDGFFGEKNNINLCTWLKQFERFCLIPSK